MEATATAPAPAPSAAPAPPAAPTPPAPAPSPAASAPAAPAPAPSAPAAPPATLLSRGAAPSPASEGAAPASPIPAKFHVKKDDGTIDEAATVAKFGDAYKQLEQRLGSGDSPPATPQDYKPTLPQGIDVEALAKDPHYTGFLAGAHAKGMTNAQVSYVLQEFARRESSRASPEAGEAELRQVWRTDGEFERGLADSHRAVSAFAKIDAARQQRIEAKFANDPDFLWLMAQVGRELQEDQSVHGGLDASESSTLEQLMGSPAYTNPKDPMHAQTVARVKALYQKKYPGQ